MTTPIKIKRSGTASSTPSSLDHGELAINYADSTLFWKDDANVIKSFVFQAYASATHASTHATGGSDALTPADIGAAPAASPAITGNATFSASSGVPVTITNTGTGNSFVVNDASGDTTPFFVDADGNVGIATSTAIARLDCAATTGTGMRVVQSGATNSNVGLFQFTGGSVGSTGAASALLRVLTNGTIRRLASFNDTTVITAAGDLGVKTTAPATALDVSGVITVSATSGSAGSYLPSLTISGDANTGFGQVSGQSDTASVFTAGHERVRVDSSGRVGIGTNPSYVLHVNGAIATTTGDVYVLGGGVRITRSSNPFILFTEGASGVGQLRASSSQLRMTDSTGASVFFALDTGSGNVGIGTGTTSPASRLDVNGVITVSATSGSAGSYAPSLTFSGDANTGFGQVSGQSDTASVFTAGYERLRVDASGNIRVGGVTSNSGVNIIAPNASGTDQSGGTLVIGGTQSTGTGAGGSISLATAGAGGTSGAALNGRVTRIEVKSSGAVRFMPLAADPASGEAGDVYYNSTTNKLRVYNGTSWVDLH